MGDHRLHVISEPRLLELLRRCEAGESADMVYAEHFVNCRVERVSGDDE